MPKQRRLPAILAALIERIVDHEGLDIEFKKAEQRLPASVWSTISAFANTNGGWIFLGIDETDGSFEITGVQKASAQLDHLHSALRNPNKINYPVCGPNDAFTEHVGDVEIIVIRVPAAPRKERPVYIDNNPYDGTFIRRHSGDYRGRKQEVDRMMREASDATADSAILTHYDWSALDLDTLARYRRRYQTFRPQSPWNDYDDQRFLEALRGYRRDRQTREEGITVAGLLLTGTPEAIQEWRSRHLIDYRRLSTSGAPDSRWDDRITWEGNLLGAFDAIYPRLISDLAVPFRLHHGTRIDDSPLHMALREALVNLLVHTDYSETDSSLIQHSPNGCFFRNPGSSRIPVKDLQSGDRSDPRNPVLVRMFRYIGLAEEAGTGLAKIFQVWWESRFQPPDIDMSTERYEFSLRLPFQQLLSEQDKEWLAALGDEWSAPEELALLYAKRAGYVDNGELRSLARLHPADATKILTSLLDRKFLQASGSGRGTRYQLGPLALSQEDTGLRTSTTNQEGSSGGVGVSSGGNEPSFGNVHQELERIAQRVRGRQRLDPSTRNSAILDLCAITPLSLSEIATYMERSPDALRDTVAALRLEGALEYLYPQSPTHPDQKYATVKNVRSNTNPHSGA